MKKLFFFLAAYFALSSFANAQTYTWNGATSDYQTASNWTPARSSPSTNDILQFNANATVTNVPTQSIGGLVLSGTASVSLQAASGASRTLTVGSSNVSGDEISVPVGCTLTLATNASGVTTETLTLGLANVTGVTANIAGTLTIQPNVTTSSSGAVTYANSTAYTLNQLVINRGNLYKVTTAGTSASSGTGPNSTSGTSTIDGTGTVYFSYLGSQYSVAYALSTTYSLGQLVNNGGNLYQVTTTGAAATSGAGPTVTTGSVTDGGQIFTYVGPSVSGNYATAYNNVYDVHYGITTVSGTVNYAGKFNNTSAYTLTTTNTLQFTSGSNFNNQRFDAAFPGANSSHTVTLAPYYNNVNVTISGAAGSVGLSVDQFPSSVNTFNIVTPYLYGGSSSSGLNMYSLSNNGGTVAASSLYEAMNGGTEVLFGSKISNINIGSGGVNISGGGNFYFATSGNQSMMVSGDFTLSGTAGFTYYNNASTPYTASLTVNNFTQTSSGYFQLNTASSQTGASLTVNGNFNQSAGTFSVSYPATLKFAGSVAQTFSTNSTIGNANFTIEIANTGGNVSLGNSTTINGTLKLTSGTLVLGSKNLTLSSTALISPITPTNASYMDASGGGLLIRQSVPASGNTIFPLGTASSYAPLIFTGGTAGANITVGIKNTFTNTVYSPNNVVNLQWSIVASAATQPTITFQYNSANQASGYTSTGAVLGTYSSAYTETALSSVSGTDPFTTSIAVNLPTSTTNLYGIGTPNSFALQLNPPTSVTATAGTASATISFTPPTNTTGIVSYKVVSNPGGFTATGTASPITVTGLNSGTAYTFTVQSSDGTNFGVSSSASNSVTPTGNYTWTGSTSNDYQVSTNWSPNRVTLGSNDVLTFSSNATVINVPTQTIGQLILSGSSTVSLQPAAVSGNQVLTVGNTNTSDNDIQIPSGCQLTIASNSYGTITLPSSYGGGASDRDKISNALIIQLAASNSAKAGISGNLTIQRNATFTLPSAPIALAASTAYTLGAYVYLNQNLFAVTTAGTTTSATTVPSSTFGTTATNGTAVLTYIGSTISGSITGSSQYGVFANTYNVGSGVTTVSGTIENQSASIAGTVNNTSLVFSTNSNFIYNRADFNSSLPTGTDMSNANVTVQGIVSSSFLPVITLPTVMASLTWNMPNVTGSSATRFTVSSGTTLTVSGNVSITQSSSSSMAINSGSSLTTINIGGNLTLDNVSLSMSRNATSWAIGGAFTMSATSSVNLIDNFYSSASSATSTMIVGGDFTQNGGTFTINGITIATTGASIGNLIVKGNFIQQAAGTITTSTTTSTSGTAPGLQVGNLVFQGSSAQTFNLNGGFTNNPNLTINNVNGVTLSGVGSIVSLGTLALTNGVLTAIAPNIVQLTNGYTGGGSSSFLDGTVNYVSSSLTAFTIPVGDNNLYKPMTINPSSSTTTTFQVTYTAATNSNSISLINSPLKSIYNLGQYSVAVLSGSMKAYITIPYNLSNGVVANTAHLFMAALNNTWSQVSTVPTVAGTTTSGTVSDSVLLTTTAQGLTVGSNNSSSNLLSVSTYTWSGGTSGNFQTATNWTPTRTSPSVSDFLVFNGTVTVSNVPTQTICQILLNNNATVTLQASTGSARTVTVTGGLSVPAGCKLQIGKGIAATDAMNLSLTNSSEGVIAGTLVIDSTFTNVYNNNFIPNNAYLLITGTIIKNGPPVSFYVDPVNGNDANVGSLANPFATLVRARDTVRTLVKTMGSNLYINLRGGKHVLDSTLNLTPLDGGCNGYDVVYQAYNNEKARIHGGKQVTGWTKVAGQNYYVANVPTSAGFDSVFRYIWVNGRKARQAKSDFINVLPKLFVLPNSKYSDNGDGFIVKTADLKSYTNLSDIRVFQQGIFKHIEFNLTSIAPINDSESIIVMAQPNFNNWTDRGDVFGTQKPIQIWNAFEELDEPGEFYLNKATRQLYYYPQPGENLTTATVTAPSIDTLVYIGGQSGNNAQNIQFQGITFEYGNWKGYLTKTFGFSQADLYSDYSGIEGQMILQYANDISINNCRFEHLAGSGIYLPSNDSNITIRGNIFNDMTAAGVLAGKSTSDKINANICSNIVIDNNVFRAIGSDFFQASGIYANVTKNMDITHNDVADVAYFGINQRYYPDTVYNTNLNNPQYSGYTNILYNRVTDYNTGGKYGFGMGDIVAGIYLYGVQSSKVKYNYVRTGGKTDPFSELYYEDAGLGLYNSWVGNVADANNGITTSFDLNPVVPQPTWTATNTVDSNYANSAAANSFVAKTTITNNSPPWTGKALSIINNAGLQASYAYLLNEFGDGSNMAGQATVTSSSTLSGSYAAANLIDGKMATSWRPNGTVGSWVQLSFPNPVAIQKLQLVPDSNYNNPEARRQFEVWVSNDANFSTYNILGGQGSKPFAYYKSWCNTGTTFTSAPPSSYDLYGMDTLGYKYIRVYGSAIGFSECRVYGRYQTVVPSVYASNSTFNASSYTPLTPVPAIYTWSQDAWDTINSSRVYFGADPKYWKNYNGNSVPMVDTAGVVSIRSLGNVMFFNSAIYQDESINFKLRLYAGNNNNGKTVYFRVTSAGKIINGYQLGFSNTSISLKRLNNLSNPTSITLYGTGGKFGNSVSNNTNLYNALTPVSIYSKAVSNGLSIKVTIGGSTIFNFTDTVSGYVTQPGFLCLANGGNDSTGLIQITDIPVTGLSLSPSSLSLSPGDTSYLTATVQPTNATIQRVVWVSSDTTVATVNSLGLVTAVNKGSCTISAITQDSGNIATTSVVVSIKQYSWTGTTNTDYQVATNWNPNRTRASATDILKFNSNATVINVPTQTIGRLLLSNNASVSLRAANGGSSVLTVGYIDSTGDELNVPAGCTLTLATNSTGVKTETLTLGLSNVSGVTANIAGTLTIQPNATVSSTGAATYANGTAYTFNQLVINKGSLYKVTTAGTSASSGSGPGVLTGTTVDGTVTFSYQGSINGSVYASSYSNAYSAQYGVTTITGTVNYAGLFTNTSAYNAVSNSLQFIGATFNNQRNDAAFPGNGALPTTNAPVYNNVNVVVNGVPYINSSNNLLLQQFPASINALNFSCPNVSSGTLQVASFSDSSTTLNAASIDINMGTGSQIMLPAIGSSSTVSVTGNMTVTTGTLYLGANGAETISVGGAISLPSTGTLSLNAAQTVSLTIKDYSQIGNGSFQTVNTANTPTLNITGNFNKTAGGFSVSGSLLNLRFTGSQAQTFNSNSGLVNTNIEIANTGTTGNNTVALLTAYNLANTLTLTSGKLVLGNNNLTLSSGASILPSTPTNASYIDASGTGLLVRQSVPATGTTLFPVGTSISYAPLSFTGGTAGANISVGVKGSFTNTVLAPANVVNLQWSILSSAASKPTVTYQYNSSDQGSGYVSAGAVLGTYENGAYSEKVLSSVTGSNPYSTTVVFAANLPTGTASFYGIGNPSSFAVAPTITFANITKNYGDAAFTLSATSNSAGAISYASSNTSVATVSGNTVTIVGAGVSTITVNQTASGNYNAGTKTATMTVNAIAPTITLANITKNYGDAAFALSATSNSAGAIGYTSSNTSVATVSGSTVTIVGAGTSTITANQAANGNYTAGLQTATLTVKTIAPTITLGNITKNYGDAAFGLSASSNSAGAIAYTSSNASVATVSGSTVTIVGVGTSTITANQAANGNYTAGSQTATLTVNAIAPTITLANITKNYGDAAFSLSASSNSSGAIAYSSSNASVATVSGSTVTIVGAGTSTITVNQTANGNYTSGSQTATLTVNAIAPTITLANITKNYGDAAFTLSANSNSVGTLTYNSGNASVATIIGNTVTIVGAGTSTITVNQTANGNYTLGSQTSTLTVNPIAPTITLANITKNYGDAAFGLSASSNSAGTITYSSSNAAVATVSGNVVTIVGVGTCTLTVSQAANGNYTAGSQTASLTVNAIAPTITFNNIVKNYGDPAFSLSASSNSAGTITYTSSNALVATVSGNTVTLIGAGTSTITASQTANGNYTSATQTATLTVNGIAPTITLANITKNYGDAVFTLSATSNSAGAISYASSNTSVATVSGNTVTIVGAGVSTITVNQTASGNYNAGIQTATLTVNAIAPTITLANITKNYSDAAFALSVTSNSAGAIGYTSSNTSVATVSGSTVTIVGAGTSTITANQAANGNYTAGSQTATLTVNTIAPTITLGNITKNYGDAAFGLSASSNSSGAIAYTSSNASVATVSGSTVTIVGVGTSTITANQAANGNYTSGSQTATLTVNAIAPTITLANITKNYGDAAFSLSASSNSSGTFGYTSSNTAVATIAGNTVSIIGAGTSTITVNQTANGNYLAGSQTATLTVVGMVPGVPTGVSAIAGNLSATVSFVAPTSNGGSPVTSYLVTSSPGGITASGTSSPVVVSGLTGGTSYTFTVQAINVTGTSVSSMATNSVIPSSNYTWTGNTNNDYQVATNWSPTRSVLNTSDVLTFTSNATVVNVPAQTIGQLILSGSSASVSLQPAVGNGIKTLVIGNTNTTDNDLVIPSGCELVLASNSNGTVMLPSSYGGGANDRDKISNALTIQLSASNSPKASINGKLTIQRNATFTLPTVPVAITAGTTYPVGTYLYQGSSGQNLYAVTASTGATANTTSVPNNIFGTSALNGGATLTYIGSVVSGGIVGGEQYGVFSNSYIVGGGVTTVAANATIENQSGSIGGSVSNTSLVLASGSNYIYNRNDGNGNLPTGTDMSGVNVTVQGIIASSFLANIIFPPTIGSLNWNTPLVTNGGSSRFAVSTGTNFTINGNATITQGATNAGFVIGTGSTLNNIGISGNLTIDNTSLFLARGNMNWTVGGAFTMSATSNVSVIDNFYSGTGTATSTLTVGDFVQNGGTFNLNNILNTAYGASVGVLNVKGSFSNNGGTFNSTATVSTSTTNPGEQTGNLVFNGSAGQTFSSTGSMTGNINITVNNTNGVTLNSPVTTSNAGTITMTNGLLNTTSTNVLILANTATNAIVGSSSAYINGPLQRRLPQSLDVGSTYLFPIGKEGSYNPVELIDATTTSSSSLAEVRAEAFATGSGGNGFNGSLVLNTNRYWQLSKAVNSGSFTNTKLRFTDIGFGTANLVANGSGLGTTDYVSLGGSSVNSPVNTIASASTSTIPNSIYCLAYNATYTWTGSTSNDFQVAGNWSPNRSNVGSADILQFTSSPSGTVTNVPTQTIGQLLLSGTATSVSLQAATGASRTLTIGNGNIAGTDLDIPSGCSLTLATGTASNDAFLLAFSGTPTASIAGNLNINSSFTGQYNNAYIATNSVTTVSGTVTNTGSITCSATNMVFSTGGNYIHNRPDGSVTQTFPTADFSNANFTVQALVNATSTQTGFNNVPTKVASFVWNTPLVSGTGGIRLNSLVGSASTFTVTGNMTVTQGSASSYFGFLTSSVTNVNIGGNLTVDKTTLNLCRGNTNWVVTGDFTMSSTTSVMVASDFYSGASAITTSFTVQNFNQNGGTFNLNSISNVATGASTGVLNVKGNFLQSAGTFTTSTSTSTSGTNPGPQVGNLILNGSSAQNLSLLGTISNAVNLTINNTNGVALTSPLTLPGTATLNLSNGFLTTTATNLLLITNTSAGSIISSGTAYINGPLQRRLPQNLAVGSTYLFPVGKGGTYSPVELVDATTTSSSSLSEIRAEAFATGSGGTGSNGSLIMNGNRYWFISKTVNSGSFSNTKLRLTDAAYGSANFVANGSGLGTTDYVSLGGASINSPINSISSSSTTTIANNYYGLGYIAYTWTGLTNTNWGLNTNWLNNSLPVSGGVIIVPGGLSNYPVLNTNATVGKITLMTGSSLKLNDYTLTTLDTILGTGSFIGSNLSNIISKGSGTVYFSQATNGASNALGSLTMGTSGTLTLGNTLNIVSKLKIDSGILSSNGNLCLLASSNGVANVPKLGGTISGNVTSQLYIPAKSVRKYSFIGSPVAQTIRNAWQQQIYITGSGNGGVICGNTNGNGGNTDRYNSNGFDKTFINAPSMFNYSLTLVNGSRWVSVANTNTVGLVPGTGYRVNIRGDRNKGTCTDQLNGNAPAPPTEVVLSAIGTLAQGDQIVNLNDTGLHIYTLLANPYPCPISFTAFKTSNPSISNKMWTFSPFGNGNYTTYSNGIIANPATGYNNVHGDKIAIGQAFFVEANKTGKTVLFTESHKIDSLIPNFQYFGAGYNQMLIRLGISDNSAAVLDECVLRYNAMGSQRYDPDWDASSLGGGNVSLSSLKNGRPLAIATRSSASNADTVYLNINSTKSGAYQLQLRDMTGFDAGTKCLLEDRFLGTAQTLDLANGYAFNITSDTMSYRGNRFVLYVNPSMPLAQSFGYVDVKKENDNAVLYWLFNGRKAKYFNVERQVEGNRFENLGTVKAVEGADGYPFKDPQAHKAGVVVYRIVAVEENGNRIYSKSVSIGFDNGGENPVTVYPNPVKDRLNVSGSGILSVALVDGSERVVALKKYDHAPNASLNVSSLAKGSYTFVVELENGKTVRKVIVKE